MSTQILHATLERRGNRLPVKGTDNGDGTCSLDVASDFTIATDMRAATSVLTRAANTTGYIAKDAVVDTNGTPEQWDLARKVGGCGTIIKARLYTNQAANVARYRLHLFNTVPAVDSADTDPYVMDNVSNVYVGFIDFDAGSTEGAGSAQAQSQNTTVRLPFVCDAADTKLYGLLETLDAFTPASGQTITIELTALNN